MRGYVPPISFGALLAVLGVATVVGVGAAVVLHRLILIPVVIGVALAIGVAYILITIGPSTEPNPPVVVDDEPFYDPVEEADRLESSGAQVGGDATTGRPPGDLESGSAPDASGAKPVESPEEDGPFRDPVEEADRLDAAGASRARPASGGEYPK